MFMLRHRYIIKLKSNNLKVFMSIYQKNNHNGTYNKHNC